MADNFVLVRNQNEALRALLEGLKFRSGSISQVHLAELENKASSFLIPSSQNQGQDQCGQTHVPKEGQIEYVNLLKREIAHYDNLNTIIDAQTKSGLQKC